MRIISQDGLSDYPYDNIFVWVDRMNQRGIGATMCSDPDSEFELGTYDSEEDALYVMRLIRQAVRNEQSFYFMPDADYVTSIRQEESEGGEL